MKISRRIVLRGIGGTVLALPFLEGLAPRGAKAGLETPPYAFFMRQANGVAQAANTGEIGEEPERFFPTALGALSAGTMSGRAVDELLDYAGQLLIVKNVNMVDYNFADGHARGAMQGLTAIGPQVEGAAGDSEAGGMSIDHRIGADLNEGGRESLYLYAGQNGWLGGACISHRGAGTRRAALPNPWEAYQTIVGGDTGGGTTTTVEVVERRRSVNDLVRAQLGRLKAHPRLSRADHARLDLHLAAVRDLEVALSCRMDMDAEMMLEGLAPGYNSTDGDEILETARLHMDVAALAIACGYTRSVALQIGNGNDGSTRYRHPMTGDQMENYHYISHRRTSHDSSGAIIPGSDLLHHYIDRQFAQTFKHMLDRLSAYEMPDGNSLLHHGVAVWYNDNSNGPPHGYRNIPYVLGGSAAGFFRQGQHIEVRPGNREANHHMMLNTIGTAVGVRNASGGDLDDFGDPSLPRGTLDELRA
jgi:hypothetical protein